MEDDLEDGEELIEIEGTVDVHRIEHHRDGITPHFISNRLHQRTELLHIDPSVSVSVFHGKQLLTELQGRHIAQKRLPCMHRTRRVCVSSENSRAGTMDDFLREVPCEELLAFAFLIAKIVRTISLTPPAYGAFTA